MSLTLSPDLAIELRSAAAPARLAAAEIQAALRRAGGPDLPIVAAAAGPRITLEHGPAGDGFVRAAGPASLTLRGDGPRGLLYAAYDLLEDLGFRWAAPGAAAERTPDLSRAGLPDASVADRPALAGRGLVIGHDQILASAEDWVIWAARSRLSTIFIHTVARPPYLGACRQLRWRTRRAALLPLIRERGLELELGGHLLRDLLPRRLFQRSPELFRFDGRRRTPDHNLCPSEPRAMAIVRATAAAFFRSYPEADVYHLWPDDLTDGGWCHCPRCAELSPADQALTVANALADQLAQSRPAARLGFLAYHDTEAAPARVRPRPNVGLLFAPRPRSYAAGIAAPANAAYAARLSELAGLFQPDGLAGRVAVFEYYLDGILFKSAVPPLPATIAADMAGYAALGAGAVHTLATGDRPARWPSPNAYLFARLAWDPTRDPDGLLAEYAAARAPADAAALCAAHQALAAAWGPALADDGSGRPRAAGRPRGSDPLGEPLYDVLDMIALEPRPTIERRLDRMLAAAGAIEAGRAAWRRALGAAPRPDLLAEQAEWEAGARLLRLLTLRQTAYVLAARRAGRAALAEALAAAHAALDDLLEWAERHVPGPARGEHQLLRMILRLQLDHLSDRHLLAPPARLALRARRFALLARLATAILR